LHRMLRLIGLALAALAVGAGVSPASGGMPASLFARSDAPATFVRADAAVNGAGEVDARLFSPVDAQTIKLYMQLPAQGGCVHLGAVLRDYPNQAPHGNLQQAAKNARLVMLGTVRAEAGGFSGAEGGTLLQVEPSEFLKSTKRRNEASYYVFFPVGSFDFNGRAYCATNPDYPPLPAVGDRLLVFIRDPDSFSSAFLPLYDGTDVVVFSQASRVGLPRRFALDSKSMNMKTMDANSILGALRSYLSKEQ
jgi:hypothetical protein